MAGSESVARPGPGQGVNVVVAHSSCVSTFTHHSPCPILFRPRIEVDLTVCFGVDAFTE